MYKTATYKQKFQDLKEWIPSILESIKKDLKNEHLRKDLYFVKTYLDSKNINKLTNEDLVNAYTKALSEEENSEQVAEFITSRWLLKHSELYNFFERELIRVNPEFTEIEQLDDKTAQQLADQASKAFSARKTYIFSVLNSVVFPDSIFHQLKEKSRQEEREAVKQEQETAEKQTLEGLKEAHEREIARLTDKYEKKLSGLQKKYLIDVEGFKKQIAQLQRKLQGKA